MGGVFGSRSQFKMNFTTDLKGNKGVFFIGFINRIRRAKAAYARSPPLLPRCADLFRHQSPWTACHYRYVPGYLLLLPFLFI